MHFITNLLASQKNCIILASTAVLGTVAAVWIWRQTKLRKSEQYLPTGKIEKIFLYPIKSLPGVELDSASVTKLGLRYGPFRDRSFLLVKEESGIFMTMRQEPSLALLKLSLRKDDIYIDAEGMETLKITLKETVEPGDRVTTCRVYGQDVQGMDCGDDIADWFQTYLGKPGFRLLQFIPSFEPRKLTNNLLNQVNPGQMLYHDDSAYHILSQASIDDLNSRLEEKMSLKNFRPNILLSGCEAYSEDQIKVGLFGSAVLLFMNHCSRCILTTVNPETGIKTEKEPLVTLRTYRLAQTEKLKKMFGNSPLFGVYMGTRKEGIISVGDEVSAIHHQ